MVLVCVTGGTGFIASWLIKLLLESGYTVRATVRDPGNLEKTSHLRKLPNAQEKLELVRADLLEDGSFDAAVDGCEGVFHTASPVVFTADNPEEEIIKPAVKGTLNVLNACAKSKSVRRVVLTSSMAAIEFNPAKIEGCTFDESWWTDEDFCIENKLWYPRSKLLAEKAAWAFAKERGLDIVAINPGMVVGLPLHPNPDAGFKVVLEVLTERQTMLQFVTPSWVDVQDVAKAHLLAFEVPSASGRYLCSEQVLDLPRMMDVLQEIVPNHKIPPKSIDNPSLSTAMFQVSNKKLKELGLSFRNVKETFKELVGYFIENRILTIQN